MTTNRPEIIIYRDNDGDFLVSFDGGKTNAYLTLDGDREYFIQPMMSVDPATEHEVWRSGPDA